MTGRDLLAPSHCSRLQQRLLYMARAPEREFTNIIENVPRWPAGERAAPGPAADDIHGYAPCAGDPELVRAIVRRERDMHGVHMSPANVLVTHGGLYALSLIFRASATPGRTALCQAPVLAAIPQLLRAAGLRTTFFATPGGALDLERLDAACRDGCGLIYLNSPNNPAGRVLGRADLAALAGLARARGVEIVVDMVYDGFVFDRARADSPLAVTDDWSSIYVVNSMSKNYGAPGLRVGWIASAPENIERLAGLLERETIAVSGHAQRAARWLLEHGNAALVEAVAAGKRRIEHWLAGSSLVRWDRPEGGCQVFVRLPVDDVEAFCDVALVEFGLGLVSASNYEGVDGPFIRLPMGAPPTVLTRALGLLGEALTRVA